MKKCTRASKCQYGNCYETDMCGLNNEEPCYKEIEEMEIAEIKADMYYADVMEADYV